MFRRDRLHKNRGVFRKFKKIIAVICSVTLFVIIVASISDEKNSDDNSKLNRPWSKATYYTKVKNTAKINVTNANGTTNGINLLLISKLSEGFIKEYLTLALNNSQGKMNSYPYHVGVENVLGLTMAEQGAYAASGGVIPVTCLPWDYSKKSPKWEKGTAWTLSRATMSVLSGNHEPLAWVNGDYVGPFQQSPQYFTDGTYKPSSMCGDGQSSGRSTGDWSYFPDQLAGLDCEASGGGSPSAVHPDPKKTSVTARMMLCSLNHNVGPSWFGQFLSTYKHGDVNAGLSDMCKEFQVPFDKYKDKLGSVFCAPEEYKWVAAFLLMENGWHITERQVDTISGKTSYHSLSVTNKIKGFDVFTKLGLGKTESQYQAYLSAHNQQDPSNYGNCWKAATQGTLWKDFGSNGKMYMLLETSGHILCSSFMGPVFYARLLKMGGLADVDPTNPDTYMNKIQQGSGSSGNNLEWVPQNTTDILKQNGIDYKKFTTNQMKVVNECIKHLKKRYVWGATGPDTFDCSGLTSYVYRTVFHIEIGRTTYDQINAGKEVAQKDLQPGDLVFPHAGHVAIYIGNGKMIHAPHTGDVVKVSNVYAFWRARRIL